MPKSIKIQYPMHYKQKSLKNQILRNIEDKKLQIKVQFPNPIIKIIQNPLGQILSKNCFPIKFINILFLFRPLTVLTLFQLLSAIMIVMMLQKTNPFLLLLFHSIVQSVPVKERNQIPQPIFIWKVYNKFFRKYFQMSLRQQKSSLFSQIDMNCSMKKPHSHKKSVRSEKLKYNLHHSFDTDCSKKSSLNENLLPQRRQYLQKSNSKLAIDTQKGEKQNFIISSGLIKYLQFQPPQEQINSKLEENNFPILRFSLGQLIKFSAYILHKNEFSSKHIPFKLLLKTVEKIQEGYSHVPYHNFSHAFSLMQLFNLCVKKSPKLLTLLTSEDHFYACLAALAHDIGHKGTNNGYEVKIKSSLAKQHQNEAVLEKMHIQKFFALMDESEDTNLLRFSSNSKRTKKFITGLILATDMARHDSGFKKLQLLKLQHSDLTSASVPQTDKQFIIEQVFHACDIGNSTQNFENYIEWAGLLSIEFCQQYRLEEEMGVEVTKCMKSENLIDIYNDQIWFVGNMVLPLWKQVCTLEFAPIELVQNVNRNIKKVKESRQEEFRLLKS